MRQIGSNVWNILKLLAQVGEIHTRENFGFYGKYHLFLRYNEAYKQALIKHEKTPLTTPGIII